jgi:putative hydrolase of the HAD superfamily
MGGVIIEYHGWKHLQEFPEWPRDLSLSLLKKWFNEEPHARDFESGRINWQQFAESLRVEFDLNYNDEEMGNAMISLLGGVSLGIDGLLKLLQPQARLLGLSNTNPLHWNYILENYAILDCFERIYTSFELGVMKPNPRTFRIVIENTGIKPGRTIFIDDDSVNVGVAEELGFRTIHAQGTDSIRKGLTEAGFSFSTSSRR